MKTAAAYLRVSDERQDEFSPDSQLKLIRDYCNKNDILLPDELIFYDDGISAKSTKKRTQFNEMIAIAKQKDKPFQMILVWKFSRFARNQEESIVYKSLLRKNGVDVVSVSEPIADNPFGGLIERIIEWMDEYYLIRLSDEVRRGMTERATRGLPNCAPAFGYGMKNGEYILLEEEAVWVRQIFEMFINGWKKRSIVDYLSKMNVKNHHGNNIDLRGIDYILSNPVYIGYTRWNPYNRTSSARKFGESSDIIEKSTHQPIIDEETWNKAQNLIKQLKRSNSRYMHESPTVHEYMLRGLVKCHSCGATLTFSSYNTTRQGIQCHNYSRGRCSTSHYISLSKLNKLVIDKLKENIQTLSFKIEPLIEIVEFPDDIDYQSLINAEHTKLNRAKQAYQEGVDSLNEYRSAKEKIESKIAQLQEERDRATLKKQGLDMNKFAETIESVIELLEDPTVSETLKNEVLKTIVDRIVLYKPSNEIDIFYH